MTNQPPNPRNSHKKKALQRRAHPRDPEPQGGPLPRRRRGRPRHRRPAHVCGLNPGRAGLAPGGQVGVGGLGGLVGPYNIYIYI